jgi:hypothetical protein
MTLNARMNLFGEVAKFTHRFVSSQKGTLFQHFSMRLTRSQFLKVMTQAIKLVHFHPEFPIL